MYSGDLEPPTGKVMEKVQGGLDVLEEYAGPLLDRYGRAVLVVGVAVVAATGLALLLSRRRSRRVLAERIQAAIPGAAAERLERAIASITSAAERVGR